MNALRTLLAFVLGYVASKIARIGGKSRDSESGKVIEEVIAPKMPITSTEATPNPITPARKVIGKVIVPARPDGGTQLRIEIEKMPAPLAEVISQATTEIAAATLRGRLAKVRWRDRAVELAAAGQVRLLIWPTEEGGASAEIVIGSRSLETLGGVRGWADVWLRWATEVLTGHPCEGAPLEAAWRAGWRISGLDLASEVEGVEMTTADVDPARWTSRYEPVVRGLVGDFLRKLELADKSKPCSLEGYRKDLDLDRLGRGEGLRVRWRALGWSGGPLWRWELRFRGPGLLLRPKSGQGGEPLDLTDPRILDDDEAIARAWAYGVGHPDRRSAGFFRLVLAGKKITRLCEVDPRWRVVQSAAPTAVPAESLAQRAERRKAEREDYETRADQWLSSALARRQAVEGLPVEQAAERALEHASRLVRTPEWADRYSLALADAQDLIEPGGQQP